MLLHPPQALTGAPRGHRVSALTGSVTGDGVPAHAGSLGAGKCHRVCGDWAQHYIGNNTPRLSPLFSRNFSTLIEKRGWFQLQSNVSNGAF